MTKEEIMFHVEMAREVGCDFIEVSGVKYHIPIKPKIIEYSDAELTAEDLVSPMSPLDDLNDEEMLYWATPHFDEMQEQKKLREQQLKEKQNE